MIEFIACSLFLIAEGANRHNAGVGTFVCRLLFQQSLPGTRIMIERSASGPYLRAQHTCAIAIFRLDLLTTITSQSLLLEGAFASQTTSVR
jgi:hypothetical protein